MTIAAAVSTFAVGVVFGLALAAPPGPMNAVIAEESVLRGWVAGFRAGLGAATADVAFFLLALFGAVTFVERLPRLRAAMVGVGGVLMLYFAYDTASDARNTFLPEAGAPDGGAPTGESRGFRKAFVLALTNPYQILFWLTVGVGLLEPGTVDVLAFVGDALAGLLVVETGSPALLVGLFSGITTWITGFPAVLVAAERRANAVAPVVAAISAVVLTGFGVLFLSEAVGSLAG